jgi:outer membrane lipoprotein-sorting protein
VNTLEININKIITGYLNGIKEFSSGFVQSNGNTIEEGKLYLKNNRLKIKYTDPSNIIIIIAENKAMYFNQDLEEVQYFNPRNSIANIFFQIFFDKYFFNDANFHEKEKSLLIYKTIVFENQEYGVSIIFEKSPLIIRKIKIENEGNITTYSILDPNFNPSLDDGLFSLVNPLIG